MTSSEHDFSYKKLYDQSTMIEGESYVLSRMLACSYIYPGSISRTTARCRTTVVYENTTAGIIVSGGTLEKWSEIGWKTIDEFFDSNIHFPEAEDALNYLLEMYKSFILGQPIAGNDYSKDPSPPPIKPRDTKKPSIRVLSFKDKYAKEDSYKEEERKDEKPKDADPDLDWI